MNLLDVLEDFTVRGDPDKDLAKVEAFVLECNKEAMKQLREDDLKLGLELLRKAEKILFDEYKHTRNEVMYRLIGITLNNLGCYYKRTNKLKVSLSYLKKALEIEVYTLHDKMNIASTHLNICAIFSSLTQHKEAIKHARIALDLLKSEKNACMLEMASDKSEEAKSMASDKYKNIITTMIMGYFNYGTELEHAKEFGNSLKALTEGFELASRELGSDHSLTHSLQKGVQSLMEKKKSVESRAEKRDEYISRVLTENKARGFSQGRRSELMIQTESKRTQSVKGIYINTQNSASKSKGSNLIRLHTEKNNTTHDSVDTFSAQKTRITLPELGDLRQGGGKPPVRGARDKLKALTNASSNKRTPVSQPHSSLPMVYMPYKDQHISAYLSSKSKKLSTDLSSKRRTNQTAFERSRDDDETENDNNHSQKEQHEDLDKQISQLKNEIREIEQEVQGNSIRNEEETIRETLRENNTSHVDSKRKSREQSQPSHPSSMKQSLQIKKDSHRPKQTIESTRSHKSNKQNPLDPIYKDLYFDTPRIEKTEESTVPGYSQPKQDQQSKFRESGYVSTDRESRNQVIQSAGLKSSLKMMSAAESTKSGSSNKKKLVHLNNSLHFGIGIEEEEFVKNLSPHSSKKSFETAGLSRVSKKIEPKKPISESYKSQIQSSIHSKRKVGNSVKDKDKDLDKEKIMVYMQYFD